MVFPAGGAEQPGLRHRCQRLHQPVRAKAGNGPGDNGGDDPPGAIFRDDTGGRGDPIAR